MWINAIAEIHTVVPDIDVERLAEFGRPVGQSRIGHVSPAFSHDVDAGDGSEGPDEYASRHAGWLCHDVQTGMLAGSKNVCVSGRPKQHLGAFRPTPVGVSGGVALGEIGFSLDDTSRNGSIDQDCPKQISGHVSWVPTEEPAFQPRGLRARLANPPLVRFQMSRSE